MDKFTVICFLLGGVIALTDVQKRYGWVLWILMALGATAVIIS